jgi:hypothetical protein
METPLEPDPVGIRERVEQAAVDGDIERPPETLERQRIRDEELHADVALDRLGACPLDRRRGGIDPDDVEAPRGDVERVLAGPAADVEHRALDRAALGKAHDRGLRSPDVPRWLTASVCSLEAHARDDTRTPPAWSTRAGRPRSAASPAPRRTRRQDRRAGPGPSSAAGNANLPLSSRSRYLLLS